MPRILNSRSFKLGFSLVLLLTLLAACGDPSNPSPTVAPAAVQASPIPTTATAKTSASPTPSKSATFYPAKTDRYELYASSEKDLNKAKDELDAAIQQFRRYFSENPPKIGVVIADTPDQAQTYMDQFKKAGLRALTFSFKPNLQKVMTGEAGTNADLIPSLGVLLTEDGPDKKLKIQDVLPVGVPQGADLKKDDLILALNGEAVTSLKDFKTRFEGIFSGTKVELKLSRQGKEITTIFDKASGAGINVVAGPLMEASGRLAHEAGSLFFRAYTENKLGKALSDTEKAKFLPDWLDEAIADLHEPSSSQQLQRSSLQRALKDGVTLIPLSELLAMNRPAMEPVNAQPILITPSSSQMGSPEPGDTFGKMVIPGTGELKLGMPREALFSSEAATLAQFLVEKEGARFIDKLAEGIRQGKTLSESLQAAKSVPTDLVALEKAWLDWLNK